MVQCVRVALTYLSVIESKHSITGETAIEQQLCIKGPSTDASKNSATIHFHGAVENRFC